MRESMRIDEHPDGDWMFRSDRFVVQFDDINSTGRGFWQLLRDGDEVARVLGMTILDEESRETFRDILHNNDS